jgi:hypothetical protein
MTDPDNLRHTVERLLEDVSLTADLVDDAAKLLLKWGVARTEAIAQREDELSPEQISVRFADLRRTVKRISEQAGQAAPGDQAARVRALLSEIAPEAQAVQKPASLLEATPEEEKPEGACRASSTEH